MLLISLFVVTLINDKEKIPDYNEEKITKEYKTEEKIENTPKELDSNHYIVKTYQNNIFLFDNENNIVKKLDINYNDLREYDKKQFNSGIKLPDISSVYQLIEDFTN